MSSLDELVVKHRILDPGVEIFFKIIEEEPELDVYCYFHWGKKEMCFYVYDENLKNQCGNAFS